MAALKLVVRGEPRRPETSWNLDRLARSLSTERRLIGASLLRIATASVLLAYLVGQWPRRHLLWGPDGLYPVWLFERDFAVTGMPSLLAVHDPWRFELLYHAGIAVALAYLVGWHPRWVGPAAYVVAWSLLRRNPFVMTGGDNLLLVCFPWLVLMNGGAYLSAASGWRMPWSDWRPAPRPYAALVHNLALVGLLGQLALMYLFAGVHKLVGAPWLDGSAAAYVLRVDRFSLPWLSPALAESEVLARGLTYWTLAFELTVPLLIWWPTARALVAVQAVLFHGGIAVLMGLVLFAVEASMFQLVVFGDDTYRRLLARLARSMRCLAPTALPARRSGQLPSMELASELAESADFAAGRVKS